MQGDEKVQRTQERRDEYEERIAEKELRRQGKKMRRAEERDWKRRAEDDDIEEERLERDEPENAGGEMMVEAVYGTGRAE